MQAEVVANFMSVLLDLEVLAVVAPVTDKILVVVILVVGVVVMDLEVLLDRADPVL
jgi:hypothetical protein